MNNDEHDTYGIFRNFVSTGLVIFERDGVLLIPRRPSTDFMLGDIDDEVVELLSQLRSLNVRFGFISDDRGMDAGTHGRSEFAALTDLLDRLLRIRDAMPDFWMAWSETPKEKMASARQQRARWPKPDASMILRVMTWYGVERKKTIFVSSSAAGVLAANDADVTCLRYYRLRSDTASPTTPESERHHPLPPSMAAIHRIRVKIEQKLGLDRRRTA